MLGSVFNHDRDWYFLILILSPSSEKKLISVSLCVNIFYTIAIEKKSIFIQITQHSLPNPILLAFVGRGTSLYAGMSSFIRFVLFMLSNVHQLSH
jgi:hypothetical protein